MTPRPSADAQPIRANPWAVLAALAMVSLLPGCVDRTASLTEQPSIESASAMDGDADAWARLCGPGLAAEIDRLAGAEAIDCGMHDRPETVVRDRARACMRSAIDAGKSFKAGRYGLGDSFRFCDVAIGRQDRVLLGVFFSFDDVLEDGRSRVWASQCADVSYKPDTIDEHAFFALQRCVDATHRIDLARLNRGADGS
jgi:hypothetical protein